jgi:hypothetical protein
MGAVEEILSPTSVMFDTVDYPQRTLCDIVYVGIL